MSLTFSTPTATTHRRRQLTELFEDIRVSKDGALFRLYYVIKLESALAIDDPDPQQAARNALT